MDKLINFEEEYNKEKPEISFERGIIEVSLNEITGSVGRYRDFENSGIFKTIDSRERMESLEKLLKEKGEFEPIELYKLKDNYYILDGHHRYKTAQKAKLEKIRAKVIEYLPPRNSFDNILTWERSRFERMTGLIDIKLTELSQYDKLLDQIREHKHYKSEEKKTEVPFFEAAKDWYENIFLPITHKIYDEKLIKNFPERTIADLYAYASDYKWEKSEKRGHDIGFDAAIAELQGKEPFTIADFIRMKFPTRLGGRRKVFERKTGLHKIYLSKDYSYTILMKQIQEHKYFMSQKQQKDIPLEEAAKDWYHEVYLPVTILISRESLPISFASRTFGDIYLLLTEKKWLESEKKGYDIGFLETVKIIITENKSYNPLKKIVRSFLRNISLIQVQNEDHK